MSLGVVRGWGRGCPEGSEESWKEGVISYVHMKSPMKKSGASSSAMSCKDFKSAMYIIDSGSSSNDDDKWGNKGASGSESGGVKSD